MLAYRPFLDPLPLHDLWWMLLLPLAVGIAAAYKAVRIPDDQLSAARYLRHVASMTLQTLAAMAALWLALVVLVEVIVPAFG